MTPGARPPGGVYGALKYILLGFVFLSAGTMAYKTGVIPVTAPDGAPAPGLKPETALSAASPGDEPPVPAAGRAAGPETAAKTALVYYFYTNIRCSSCKAIEAYTKEAVEKNFASGYKGWKVAFRAVNVEEAPNGHFSADYWLNSKSVVVQKFSGDKALKWGKLEKVWQLLGDKEAFMDYVAAGTRKLLDEK